MQSYNRVTDAYGGVDRESMTSVLCVKNRRRMRADAADRLAIGLSQSGLSTTVSSRLNQSKTYQLEWLKMLDGKPYEMRDFERHRPRHLPIGRIVRTEENHRQRWAG